MNKTLWILAAVTAALGAVLFGVILKRLIQAYRKEYEEFLPLQLQFRYTADQASVQPRADRFHWLFLCMLFYAGLAMAVVTHNNAQQAWIRLAMYVLTAMACFLGVLETLMLITSKPKAAPVFGLGKWVLFALWTACMFLSLFVTSWSY